MRKRQPRAAFLLHKIMSDARRSRRCTEPNEFPPGGQAGEEDEFVRRSIRDPLSALMERRDVKVLLSRIRENHADTVVLKIKDQVLSDINSFVMDEIIISLHKNRVCQALYIQNLGRYDTQPLKDFHDLQCSQPPGTGGFWGISLVPGSIPSQLPTQFSVKSCALLTFFHSPHPFSSLYVQIWIGPLRTSSLRTLLSSSKSAPFGASTLERRTTSQPGSGSTSAMPCSRPT